MKIPKLVTNTISINAPTTDVWDTLVNPAKTKVYMFGCETISDWTVGSDLLWRGHYEGKDMVFVKGKIKVIEPNKLLVYTVFDPFASYPDIPENHLSVTYKLEQLGAQTVLTIIQDGFEGAAEGEKRYEEVYNKGEGWNPILVQIKALVEGN